MEKATGYLNSMFKYANDLSLKGFERSCKYYGYFYKGLLPENKNTKILDVGCGTGQFLYFLKKSGYKNYYGIDISEEQIEFCKENASKNVFLTDGFDYLKNNGGFGLIVLNDVLANIKVERLLEFLKLVHDSLGNNGKVLVKTPNMANPFNLGNRYSDITQVMGFTETTLKQALIMSGFEDIIIKGSSYPVISFQSFVARIMEKFIHLVLKISLKVQGQGLYKILDKSVIASASK